VNDGQNPVLSAWRSRPFGVNYFLVTLWPRSRNARK
jgi:hypothetical protein